MRMLYALYAFTILFFTWRATGVTEAADIMRKIVIALWIAGLVAVLAEWKYARHVALAAFAPVFAFLIFETVMLYTTPGAVIVPSQAAFNVALFAVGVVLCVWLIRPQTQRA